MTMAGRDLHPSPSENSILTRTTVPGLHLIIYSVSVVIPKFREQGILIRRYISFRGLLNWTTLVCTAFRVV